MTKAQTLTITFGPTQTRLGKVHSVRLSASGEQVIMVCTGRVMASLLPADDKPLTCKSCAAKGA